jgi:hypothetical protein
MSVNGITNTSQTYDSKETKKVKADSRKTDDIKQNEADSSAAVYEKSQESNTTGKIYKRDTETVERLKADADRRAESLRQLVEKMLTKQGQTYNDATDIYKLLREGKLEIDPETKAQAQKDIAEDGYWGIEQTSDRIVSFAKALTGGNNSKADEMIDAVKKGFEQATKAWGDELPDISKKTLEAAINKLEAWRDNKEDDSSESMRNDAADNFTNQAATEAIAK